jgi:hypothetical protein
MVMSARKSKKVSLLFLYIMAVSVRMIIRLEDILILNGKLAPLLRSIPQG